MSGAGAAPAGATEEASTEPLGLWEGIGVEIEYAIVDAATLDVKPVADRLLAAALGLAPGGPGAFEPGDVDRAPLAWSNELALHVIEMKTAAPVASFVGLAARFQDSVLEIAELLDGLDARLLPGGMHPWMDPRSELALWPHEFTDVYRAFDRIFGCSGHGWANLQSTHVNLPFRGDEEFARLHDAVRLVLPLIPALAASSPVLDGVLGPALDNRLLAYRDNARNVPSVGGGVVPERVRSRSHYREAILERIYADLRPMDPEGVLRHEWVNARGATARFSRGSIEIRVIDSQECIPSDLAVAAAAVAAVRGLSIVEPMPDDEVLLDVLDRTVRLGRTALVGDAAYLERLGFDGGRPRTAGDVWAALAEPVLSDPTVPELHGPLRTIMDRGPLAERIVAALGQVAPSRARLREVYGALCDCVEAGEPFTD
ncbi:MAG: glutamate--cysteine ligase [Myxococcales bacterium]|nr:glutamate--cysteine ligase [Myxococcales bacterium]